VLIDVADDKGVTKTMKAVFKRFTEGRRKVPKSKDQEYEIEWLSVTLALTKRPTLNPRAFTRPSPRNPTQPFLLPLNLPPLRSLLLPANLPLTPYQGFTSWVTSVKLTSLGFGKLLKQVDEKIAAKATQLVRPLTQKFVEVSPS
jgi:hypothetical protein